MKKLKDFIFLKYFANNIKYVYYQNKKYQIKNIDNLFYKWNVSNMSLTNLDGLHVLFLPKETVIAECEIDGNCINESVGLIMSRFDTKEDLIKTLDFVEISKKASSFKLDLALKTITTMNLNTLHKSPYVYIINYFSEKITRCLEFDIPMKNITSIVDNSKKMKIPNSVIRYFLSNQNENVIVIQSKCLTVHNKINELKLSKDLNLWVYDTSNNTIDDLHDILFYEALKQNIIIKRFVFYSLKDNRIEGNKYEIL